MPFSELKPKEKRIAENDVAVLFSRSAFIAKPSVEQLTDIFRPTIKYKNGTLFLSDNAVGALRRLARLAFDLPELSTAVTFSEVYNQLLSSYAELVQHDLLPTAKEFLSEAITALLSTVKDYEFLVRIEGLLLRDQALLQLGSVRIQQPDPQLFERIRLDRVLPPAPIYEEFKQGLWLTGCGRGSRKIALERFELRVLQVIGLLGVCGAILYKGAIWRSRVRAVISPNDNRRAISILSWANDGDDPSLTRKFGDEQDLELTPQLLSYLRSTCFLDQLASLPDQAHLTELQHALLRALYWFAEAYRDSNITMKFVKLWSCAESFFAIEKEGITDLNTKGLTTVLVFGGFGVVPPAEYARTKRRLRKMYDQRSLALHRGDFGHIEAVELNDLSFWMGWLIVSMASLCDRGYRTLKQVYEQVSRLDQSMKIDTTGQTCAPA